MGRPVGKKGIERRKRPRGKNRPKTGREAATTRGRLKQKEECYHCGKNLKGSERALFVEEEIGRIFCSEECITAYFAPDVDILEKEFFRHLSGNDLAPEKREEFAYLRWITLEEPDEIWRQKTMSGDYRYTLISEFKPATKSVWCVCVCLFLRGEPSFLFLSFPTIEPEMVEFYRRGEKVEFHKRGKGHDGARVAREDGTGEGHAAPSPAESMIDGLADEWTQDETLRAQITQKRKDDDIPPEEFELYQGCFNETLEEPDEVWSTELEGSGSLHLYHFIRAYPDEKPGMWYVIVAKETPDQEQIEILDAFPTRDPKLVERCREGEMEAGTRLTSAPSRLVH